MFTVIEAVGSIWWKIIQPETNVVLAGLVKCYQLLKFAACSSHMSSFITNWFNKLCIYLLKTVILPSALSSNGSPTPCQQILEPATAPGLLHTDVCSSASNAFSVTHAGPSQNLAGALRIKLKYCIEKTKFFSSVSVFIHYYNIYD